MVSAELAGGVTHIQTQKEGPARCLGLKCCKINIMQYIVLYDRVDDHSLTSSGVLFEFSFNAVSVIRFRLVEGVRSTTHLTKCFSARCVQLHISPREVPQSQKKLHLVA